MATNQTDAEYFFDLLPVTVRDCLRVQASRRGNLRFKLKQDKREDFASIMLIIGMLRSNDDYWVAPLPHGYGGAIACQSWCDVKHLFNYLRWREAREE